METLPTDWLSLLILTFVLGMKHGFDADHLATIDGNKVVQHQAGTVYLLIHPGTFGPTGMS